MRMILGVGEERQGEKTRRSGDACDSLVLWDMDAGALGRHTWNWDRGWSATVPGIRAVRGDNWDLASVPTVAHARRRWAAARTDYTWTAHPVALASLRCFVDEDRRCERAQRLAPATKRV